MTTPTRSTWCARSLPNDSPSRPVERARVPGRHGAAVADIAVLDLNLPDMNGIELLRRMRTRHPTIEVILTANYSTDAAVSAIKAGASDYLTEPVEVGRFREALDRSVQTIRGNQDLRIADTDLASRFSFEGMVGRSLAVRRVFELIRRIGPHFRAALVTGPSGTGKELVARALHTHSGVTRIALLWCVIAPRFRSR